MPKKKKQPQRQTPEVDMTEIVWSTAAEMGNQRVRDGIIAQAVVHYVEEMAYIAHWLTPSGRGGYVAKRIGREASSKGLEKNPTNHPDQKFWTEQNLVERPSADSIRVTDCKRFPCEKHKISSCKYAVPRMLGEKYGKGVPMVIYAHSEWPLPAKKMYCTCSGAKQEEVDGHYDATVVEWDWGQRERKGDKGGEGHRGSD
ncbi:MAG: hypothetical protein DRR19_02605 [Candidatus Parabeggiatoa sp. nov. 1]|nr:MAG: hypothetical protein DRR19_02605 [Gammaproteobacteria bacterium]